ncbi:family 1 glycosylhydrolase, partial [Micromonospora sp. NPDC003944]
MSHPIPEENHPVPDLSKLPPDFLWGVATAAYQIEGAGDVERRAPTNRDT